MRLDRACAIGGFSYTRLTIRDQRTRWGSCSRGGAMSFNWRLLLAPSWWLRLRRLGTGVRHLEFMDHSPRFWNWLRDCPDHRQHDACCWWNAGTLVL